MYGFCQRTGCEEEAEVLFRADWQVGNIANRRYCHTHGEEAVEKEGGSIRSLDPDAGR